MTFLDKEKTPFAATKAGLVVNTILGLPKATGQVLKDIGQGIARNIASAGLTVSGGLQTKNREMFKAGATREEIEKERVIAEPFEVENIKSLFGQELWKRTFGDEPIESIEARVVKAEDSIKDSPFAKNFGLDRIATPLAFGGIMGMTAMDLTPFGGLEKNAAKQILKETTKEGSFRIAKQLGASDDVAKVIAPIFASTKTEKEALKSLEVYKSMKGVKSLADETAQKGVKAIDDTISKAKASGQSLVEEAKKYKSAEDFANKASSDVIDKLRADGVRGAEQRMAFWEKATKGMDKTPVIDSLNPTGGLFVDYTPEARMTAKLADNITTLDKTMGKSPDEMITIYRGAPNNQKSIVGGDFVTTNYDLAKSYTGDGNVLSKKVKLSDVLDDIEDPLGEEYLYRPKVDDTTSSIKSAKQSGQSFDEWVKGQEKNQVFRGANDTKIGVDQAIFTSPNRDLAKGYGDKLQTFYKQQGKTLDLTRADSSVLEKLLSTEIKQADDVLKKYNVPTEIVDDFARNGISTKNFDYLKTLGERENPNRIAVFEAMRIKAVAKNPTDINFGMAGNKEIITAAKREGYDYIIRNSEDITKSFSGTEVVSINPRKTLKTRSQLKAEWDGVGEVVKQPKVNRAEYDEGWFDRKQIELPEELQMKEYNLQLEKEALNENQAQFLTKYASKSGEFKGGLKEVTGTGKSEFGKRGDDIVTELGFKDSEEARIAYDNFVTRKEDVKMAENQLKQEVKEYKLQLATKGQALAKSPAVKVLETEAIETGSAEARTLQKMAEESLGQANLGDDLGALSLPRSIEVSQTPVNKKVHLLDYIRTPDRVLKKIGLEKEADFLREQYDKYLKELPDNIDKITQWSKEVSKESNPRIFRWLDGQAVDLNTQELKVGKEIKSWLGEWAERLDLPKDNRIAEYITHIFDDQLIKKEFDEDLAKIIADKIPGSVYDPFLLKRLGAKGYIEDTWKALDAYVKRATRKVHLDPALSKIEDKAASFEKSQWDYVKSYVDRVNMRPMDIDNLLDNGIKSMVGYRFGQRPTATISRTLRQMTYRAMLGLNLSSALKNISQGVNTYAKLGERYTLTGYAKLFSSKAREELVTEGVLNAGFIQDRALSATKKAIEKVDKALFFFFENAERINRGAAYFGAKAKALNAGKSEIEAIKEAKKLVRDTQFTFGSIDTPIALQSDIGKTLGQFQSFTTKQIEFLGEMAKNKEYAGLMRYAIGCLVFINTIGKAFGMEPKDLLPIFRIGTPPSLKAPWEILKAVADAPDKYGRERSLGQKVSDIGKSTLGLIPAGTQIKKTIQGISAVEEGASKNKAGKVQFEVGGSLPKDIQAIIFGKYASPEAKEYFNPKKKTKNKMSF